MRTITVENNKIVVEVDGAKVRYSLEIVRKRIDSLLQDLEEWRKYERLLTPRAADICYESASSNHIWQPLKFGEVCIACGKCR